MNRLPNLYAIVYRLCGTTEPTGQTEIDSTRIVNLSDTAELATRLVEQIIGTNTSDYSQEVQKMATDVKQDFITNLQRLLPPKEPSQEFKEAIAQAVSALNTVLEKNVSSFAEPTTCNAPPEPNPIDKPNDTIAYLISILTEKCRGELYDIMPNRPCTSNGNHIITVIRHAVKVDVTLNPIEYEEVRNLVVTIDNLERWKK